MSGRVLVVGVGNLLRRDDGFGIEVAQRLEVIGADMVEVIPTGVGSADITALAADRIIREILGGIALRRRSQSSGIPNDKEER